MPQISIPVFRTLFIFLIVLTCFSSYTIAQTQKKVIDEKFYAFDLYPFELAEGNGKWGLMLKPVYDRELAMNYFKRNFHYNTRLDTLPGCGWLAQPHYDKFERWSYGPAFQFMIGTYGTTIDVFTLSGELLGKEVSDFLPEKTSKEKRGVAITMTTAGKRKWFYEGDFYNSNSTIYYQSPLFDKMEVLRDTALGVFNFITENSGKQRIFNELGHEGELMLAYEFKKPEAPAEPIAAVVVKEDPVKEAEAPAKTFAATVIKEEPVKEAEVVAAVKEEPVKEIAVAHTPTPAITVIKEKPVNIEPILTEEATLAAENEQKAKREAEIKAAVVKAIREAEEKGQPAKTTPVQKPTPVENTVQKAPASPEIKAAVEGVLKEAQEQEEIAKIARQEKLLEEAVRAAEAEKASYIAEALQQMKQPVKAEKPAVPANAGALITDRNIVMHKIMDREKLATLVQYKENELWGLQTEEGKVLIYPVFKSINMVHPTNPELKYANIYAAIELDLNGTILKLTNPNFAGPESLGTHTVKCATCKGGVKTTEVKWDAVKGKYVY